MHAVVAGSTLASQNPRNTPHANHFWTLNLLYNYNYNCNYHYHYNYNNTTLHSNPNSNSNYTTLQLQLQLHLHYTTTTHTTPSSCASGDHCNHSKKHNSSHLSVHQWVRSDIHASQQQTSPTGFRFLKLLPPPCAILCYLHCIPIMALCGCYIKYIYYIYNPYDIPMVKIRLSGHIPIYPH